VDRDGTGPPDAEEESPDQEPLSSDVFKKIRRLTGGAAPLADAFSVVEEVFAPYQREARLFREAQKRRGDALPAPTDLPHLLPLEPPPHDDEKAD
jgi:hypothetical protein